MQSQVGVNQWWAALTVWAVVNAVNVHRRRASSRGCAPQAWT